MLQHVQATGHRSRCSTKLSQHGLLLLLTDVAWNRESTVGHHVCSYGKPSWDLISPHPHLLCCRRCRYSFSCYTPVQRVFVSLSSSPSKRITWPPKNLKPRKLSHSPMPSVDNVPLHPRLLGNRSPHSTQYCATHMVASPCPEKGKRVPCPVDPNHTVFEHQISSHMKVRDLVDGWIGVTLI